MNPTRIEPVTVITEALTRLVLALVRNPSAASVTSSIHGTTVVFVIRVAPDDRRRVIGSDGKHIQALEVLAEEGAKRIGLEGWVTLDEKTPVPAQAGLRTAAFGAYNAKQVQSLPGLLRQTALLFVTVPGSLAVQASELGGLTLLDLQVNRADYSALYGRPTTFRYGVDGHLLGALKNLLDGVGKNNGRAIRVILSEVAAPAPKWSA